MATVIKAHQKVDHAARQHFQTVVKAQEILFWNG